MAAAVVEDVQLIRESSWIVSQGSLDSCVSVVFLDPSSGEPAVPSSPHGGNVVLVPPPEPVPCEVTIKFQGRLCNVQSFYILSTARTCELYSQSEPMKDPEYICTVRGWTPERDNVLSPNGESFQEMNSASYLANIVSEEDGIVDGGIKCASAKLDSEVHPFDNIKEGIPTTDGLRKTDPTLINYSRTSENNDLERSVYSSGEDSWVEVKLNGSLSCECPFKRPTVPVSICGQLDEKQQGVHSLDMHSEGNLRTIAVTSSLLNAEMKYDNLLSTEPGVSTSCPAEKFQSMPTVQQSVAQQNMYEAELELVDHSPWASLTVRLLSLQDRSHVVIDQMVVLVVLGPPAPISLSSNPSGSGGSSALLAMLIPSMLQMVRGAPNQRLQDTSLSVSNGNMSSNSLENMIKGHQPFESTSIIKDGTFVRKDENQKIALKSCIQTDENAMVNMEVIEEGKQGPLAPLHILKKEINIETDVACVSSRTESTLKSVNSNEKCLLPTIIIPSVGESRTLNSEESVEQPLQIIPEVLLTHDAEPLSSHSCEHDNGSKYEHKNWSKSSSVFSTLETFSERFDRLEALCMRMEAYLITTVERLDQRLTLLEIEHSKVPVQTPLEPKHYESPLCGSPDLSVSPRSPGLGCFGGKEMDATVSAAWIGSTTCEDSETQGVDAEESLGSHDIKNTSQGGCLGGDYEVTKTLDFEDPPPNKALGSRPSTVETVLVCPERKPQVSLDDAWASALSAFSSSCIPTEKSISMPYVALDSEFAHEISELKEGSQSSDPSSHVSASTLPADFVCTLTKRTQDLSRDVSGENPTILFFGFENLESTSHLMFCDTVHASAELQTGSSLLSEETDLESHYCDDIVDKENKLQLCWDDYGKASQTSLCNETNAEKSLIGLQGHNADHYGAAIQSIDKDENSYNFLGHKSEKNPGAMFDLLSLNEPSEHIEQKVTVSRVETLVLDMKGTIHNRLQNAFVDFSDPEPEHIEQKTTVAGLEALILFHNELQNAFVDFSDPEPLDRYYTFLRGVNDVKCTEINAPSCEADLGNFLGEDSASEQDDMACSKNSVCNVNALEFESCGKDFSVCEWTGGQNLFLTQGPEMMVTELSTHGGDLEDCFFNSNSELPCIHSNRCCPEDWFFDFSSSDTGSLHMNYGQQQQLRVNAVFPGFEDFS